MLEVGFLVVEDEDEDWFDFVVVIDPEEPGRVYLKMVPVWLRA